MFFIKQETLRLQIIFNSKNKLHNPAFAKVNLTKIIGRKTARKLIEQSFFLLN
jgi:hypothetical protein